MDRPRRANERQPALTPVEFHILLSLSAGDRHGYGIIQDIEERGLIEPAVRRRGSEAADERRNYYRITSAGLGAAKAEARRLEALTRAARLGGLLPKGAR
jgi:DNA-binding PadR family transcriptional regulator